MESKKFRDIIGAYASIYESKEETEMEEGEEEEKEEYKGKKKGKKEKEESGEDEKEMKEGVDLFDYILEHLVSEGYADTNKAALAIMANMSEEWKKSILLELTPLGVKTAGAVDDQRRGSTRDKDLKDTRDALDKMKAYPNGFPGVKGV